MGFESAFKSGYLGDPDVVSGLVGEFCAQANEVLFGLGTGSLDKAEFLSRSNDLIRQYGDIFSGRVPGFEIIDGYNDRTLKMKLRADLGEFWQQQREKWDDDSVCVLFEWLFLHIAESIKRADGDEMLLEIMLKPQVQQVVKTLMGREERVGEPVWRH